MALVQEARRMADDLCDHWGDTGEMPCVPDVVDWLPKRIVLEMRALADRVAQARRDAERWSAAGGQPTTSPLAVRAQELLAQFQEGLLRYSKTQSPPPRDLLEAFVASDDAAEDDPLGGLADALQRRWQAADRLRAPLVQGGWLKQAWLTEARETSRRLASRSESGSEAGPTPDPAVRLRTLTLRLEPLILLLRRASSAYSLQVGFNP